MSVTTKKAPLWSKDQISAIEAEFNANGDITNTRLGEMLEENAVFAGKNLQMLRGKVSRCEMYKPNEPKTVGNTSTSVIRKSTIVEKIGQSNLESCEKAWRRIVVEKPFGRDLETSQLLDAKLHAVFLEDQIYRMDHYLGKETVQNILAFRFGNGIFEPLWNRKYIDHIQITMAETEGVGTRAGYYDKAGAVRDVFQNHLLQLLSLTAMEAPAHRLLDSGILDRLHGGLAVADEARTRVRARKPTD